MRIPEEAPPLNPWPFLFGDAVLITTAFLIAGTAAAPLGPLALIAATVCVVLGAILAVIPFLLNHARSQEMALDERQREIAALAQTTAASAEQISIAAANLHSLAENTARALKLGETLPHRLQEKVNEFKAQLNEVAVNENEALAQEINTLRTGETERLETALAGVRRIATDLSAFDAGIRKQIKELGEAALEKSSRTAAVLEAAHTDAKEAIARATAEALAALRQAVAEAGVELGRRFAAPPEKADDRSGAPADAAESVHPGPSPHTSATEAARLPSIAATTLADPITIPKSEPAAEDVPVAPAVEKPPRRRPTRKAPDASPELGLDLDAAPAGTASEYDQEPPAAAASAVSADGMTRLLVTAYIGIGNKLHVRGEGPGLSWERGVPLQFVSIGRWRWETPDATAPVKLRLYKNDELECATLGVVTIAPGHQHEVSASFN